MSLVGFFDILGTREAVLSDRFDELACLDFAGPAVVAAYYFPDVRMAVFSDSIIVSAEDGHEPSFFNAVGHMYLDWYADFIFVRGGIACGDIRWVDHEPTDKIASRCANITCARVYGKGLVKAYELEQRAGPGAIAYLTEDAAARMSKVDPNAVLDGVSPMLCWAQEHHARTMLGYADLNLNGEVTEGASRRHAAATKHYWHQVVSQAKFPAA